MSKNERLQILLTSEQKRKLEAKAKREGFDSATDTVKFLINNFINGRIDFTFNKEYVEILDPETEREVLEAIKEVEQGLAVTIDPRDPNFHQKMIDISKKDRATG
jgi:hypothetical protein